MEKPLTASEVKYYWQLCQINRSPIIISANSKTWNPLINLPFFAIWQLFHSTLSGPTIVPASLSVLYCANGRRKISHHAEVAFNSLERIDAIFTNSSKTLPGTFVLTLFISELQRLRCCRCFRRPMQDSASEHPWMR